MSTTGTKENKSKKKKDPPKKGSNAGYIVAGVATAAIVGAGIFFFAGPASAKSTKSKGSKAKLKGKGSASPPRSAGGGRGGAQTPGRTPPDRELDDDARQAGGSAGPGGALPPNDSGRGKGSGKGKGKRASGGDAASQGETEAEDKGRKDDVPMGFFWGDAAKIPADFDYQSNQIWVSPDRTAAAAGFYFFMDGLDENGDRVTWDEQGLSFLIGDGSVLPPTRDRDHREDPVPSLRKILRKKDPDTGEPRLDSVFSWIAAYYGTGISPLEAATSRGVDLLQDMVDEASVLSGGQKRPLNLNGPLRTFYGYALQRMELGRRAIYGDGFAWGQGEDAVG